MLEEDLLPITEQEILIEVSKELEIPLKDVEKTYSIWMKYLKHISKETNQSNIHFPQLGQMYYSTVRSNNITSPTAKKERDEKIKGINEFFTGTENINDHETIPIVHRWGLNRPDYRTYGDEKFNLNSIVSKQNEKFYEKDNEFLK